MVLPRDAMNIALTMLLQGVYLSVA